MSRVQRIPIPFIYLVKVGLIKFSSSFNFTERTNLCFSRYDLWTIITCPKADIALCKGIRIPESAKFFLVESWIQQMFAVESGIPLEESGIPLIIGIRNPTNDWNLESHYWLESGTPLMLGSRNPSSTDKDSRIQHPESGILGVDWSRMSLLSCGKCRRTWTKSPI